MKIGLVTPNYPPNTFGGGEISAQLLVEQLRERGHEVEVLSFDSEPEGDYDYVERVPQDSARFDVRNIKARPKIKEFAEDKDVVHSYNMTFHPAVASLRNVKTVATLNSYQFFYPYSVPGVEDNPTSGTYRIVHDYICRFILRRMDRFIALSSAVKEQYSRIMPKEKLELVPNMYDPDFGYEGDIEVRENEIIYVGGFVEKKGLQDLIEVVKDLPDYSLRIVGNGERRELLEQKVESNNLEERVTFEGYVDHEDLAEYYARAGWFIHASKWPEPLNRTLFESMQTDTAALCSDMGGAKDVLPEEQIFQDPSEIPDLLRNSDRDEIVRDQRAILENYSPEKIVGQLEQVYK